MKWLERVLINFPGFGNMIKVNVIAESFGVVTYNNWYLILGVMGFSPVVLVYRKMYREAILTAVVSFILAPIMGYGALAKIFNSGMTLLTMSLFQNHIKNTILTAIGRTTEEKIAYLQNALKPDFLGAIFATIIYVAILTLIGHSGYFN